MSIPQLPKVEENMKLEELANLVAMLIKEVSWIFDKNIDSSNTREIGGYRVTKNSISSKNGAVGLSSASTPDDDIRIWAGDVEKEEASFRVYESGLLVAINAYLSGTISAAQFIGGIVTGALIQTAGAGTFPRIEFSSSNNLIKAERNSTSRVSLDPDRFGEIGFIFESPIVAGVLTLLQSGVLSFGTNFGGTHIFSVNGFVDIESMLAKVRFTSWDNIYSTGNSQTLQEALNNIYAYLGSLDARITALGG